MRETYQHILQLREHAEWAKGGFYDLMYVNPHLHRQYAFVRHLGKKFALVIANFSHDEETIAVNLPKHFFEYAGIKENPKQLLTDALSGKKRSVPFTSTEPLSVTLPAYGGVILMK